MEELIQQIKHRFGWELRSPFTQKELEGLIQTGDEIGEAIERWLPGFRGDVWIRRNLGKAIFHKGGVPQKFVSFFNAGAEISLVFPNRHVWLEPSTFESLRPTRWVAHELGHVLDNRYRWMAIWFGSGPSDELMRTLNTKPARLRWANTKVLAERMPVEFSWTHHNEGRNPKYGDNSSADYFAETWMWSIYRPNVVPDAARTWFLDWIRDQSVWMMD